MAPSAKTQRPTRERLIRAAVQLFQTHGYHGTGLSDLLASAKTPKGSLYHHFPGGKEQLAVAALAWLEAEVTGFLDGFAASTGGFGLMVEGLARFTAQGLLEQRFARGSLMAVLAQDALDSAAISQAVRRYAASIRGRLAAAYQVEHAGEDGAVVADLAMAVVQGASVLARIEGRPERAVELAEEWLRTIGRS